MTSRKERRLARTAKPEKAARRGAAAGVNDAYCTECQSWYDSSNSGQVQKHAH